MKSDLEKNIERGYSFLRGHRISWTGEKWIYADNGEDIPANGGKLRPCKKCGKTYPIGDYDPCLGVLPGVDNACCGHGDRESSYDKLTRKPTTLVVGVCHIRFKNGIIVKGFYQEKNDA